MPTIYRILWFIVASIGALIVAISVPLAYSTGGYNVDMYDLGLFITSMICSVGVFLLLLGGFLLKNRFIWIAPVVLGIVYLAVLPRVWAPHQLVDRSVGWMDWRACLETAFPAIVSIAGGLLMRRVSFRPRSLTA